MLQAFRVFFKKTSPGAGEKRIAASLALLAMTWASVSAPKERRADLFPVIARRGKAPTWQSVLKYLLLLHMRRGGFHHQALGAHLVEGNLQQGVAAHLLDGQDHALAKGLVAHGVAFFEGGGRGRGRGREYIIIFFNP